MSTNLDQSHVETRGKLLTFPRATQPVMRKQGSDVLKYGLAGTVVGLLLIAGIVWLWSLNSESTEKYVTVAIGRGAITRTVTATGTVNPELTIIVGTYVSGVIQNLSCDYNTQVKAGQVCAKIDPRPYQATLNQYIGQLMRDQAILDKDRDNLGRYQTLAAQNSIARQQAEDQVHVVQQDEGTVKLDQALVDAARLNLGYTDIVSPVDGTVVFRNVTQGQTVAASFQTPTLFLIATDLKKMQVDTNTSESDIGEVKERNRATFTVDAFPNRIFEGYVGQVRQSPQTVQNVVTFDAVISVDNSDLALKPGMTASTQIIVAQRTDVLRVPNQALRYVPGGLFGIEAHGGAPANGQSQIWLLRDGKPTPVAVEVGLDDGNFTEIVRGDVRESDAVIIAESHSEAGGLQALPQPRL